MEASASVRPWGDPTRNVFGDSSIITGGALRDIAGSVTAVSIAQLEKPPGQPNVSPTRRFAPSLIDPKAAWPGRAPSFFGRVSSVSGEFVSRNTGVLAGIKVPENRKKLLGIGAVVILVLIVGLATGIPLSRRNQAIVGTQDVTQSAIAPPSNPQPQTAVATIAVAANQGAIETIAEVTTNPTTTRAITTTTQTTARTTSTTAP
ncbi:hypothetical protein HDU93_006481, partial [Gonapodya sp. JEL0774]